MKRWVVASVASGILLVSSCTAIPDEQVASDVGAAEDASLVDSTDAEAVPEMTPEFVSGGSAQDNLPYIDFVLKEKGAGSGIFGSLDSVSALEEAGFSRADMEVTSDRTKLGLAAESVTIAIVIDGECAMGQWGAGWYSSSVAPLLGTGTCLVGDTLSLD